MSRRRHRPTWIEETKLIRCKYEKNASSLGRSAERLFSGMDDAAQQAALRADDVSALLRALL
jgi:hypothetical protein